jgi:hypothetical protein
MTDIKLDLKTHDLELKNGDLQLTAVGTEETAPRLSIKLRIFQGEYFLNTLFGVPYYQSILTKGVNKSIVDGIFKSNIINTKGVVRISSYQSAFVPLTREYRARFSVVSDTGESVIVEV